MHTWAEIDLTAIRRNAEGFRRFLHGSELIAVVKANAYGHGAVAVARALEEIADRFAVATPDEAQELRQSGIVKPILLLYPVLPETVNLALEAGAELTVASHDDARIAAEAAQRLGKRARVHLKANTGMNRYGVPFSEFTGVWEMCKADPRLEIIGLWTHFASADEPTDTFTIEQYALFSTLLRELDTTNLLIHAANSGAALNFPKMRLGAARIGISLYGAYPGPATERSVHLAPALTWKSRVASVQTLQEEESVSYNRLFTAAHDMRVATVTVGYADGYPRLASNRGEVLIRGKRARILGRICMDAMVCDVSDIPDAAYDDTATLIGKDGEDEISVDEVAAWGETISYEIFTRLGRRVVRLYG